MEQERLVLDMIVEEAMDDGAPEDRVEFAITSDEMAGWALRKIRKAREAHAEYAGECKARIDRLTKSVEEIQARMATDKAAAERTEAFFTGKLAEYFGRLPEGAIKRTKTLRKYRLPEGDLVIKSQEPQTIHDDDKLLPYLKALGRDDLIKITEAPRWAEVKKTLAIKADGAYDTQTGERVPGVSVIGRPDVFEVKF